MNVEPNFNKNVNDVFTLVLRLLEIIQIVKNIIALLV